jgi:hypothetical protein
LLSVAPNVSVTPLRVFDTTLETSPSVLAAALFWARARCFDILSLSLSTGRNDCRDYLYWACSHLQRAGTIIVAASRNGIGGGYPAQFDNVLGVSIAADNEVSSGSFRTEALDVIVPREWIGLHQRQRSLIDASTSSATALIAGIIANLLHDGHSRSLAELREKIAMIVDVTSAKQQDIYREVGAEPIATAFPIPK